MEIPRVDSVGAVAAVSSLAPSADKDVPVRQMVTAVHELNRAGLMGQGRQLSFTRDPNTRKPVIQIIDQDTGDVIDQIPAETVLQLAGQLR